MLNDLIETKGVRQELNTTRGEKQVGTKSFFRALKARAGAWIR